jgi:amino acid transporter
LNIYKRSFWSKVNRITYTPINAVWLVVSLSCSLVCIGIGSTETVVSIFNITAPALDLSYVAVIFAFIIYRHRIHFVQGPFSLGGWGRYVNVIAIAWVCVISLILFFPTVRPVTAANM